MSAQFWQQLKHLSAQVTALQQAIDQFSDRLLLVEAEKAPAVEELDVDTLQPVVKRGPGRPRKVPQ